MASRRLTDLQIPCYRRAEAFVVKCEKSGIDLLVYCTRRSLSEQAALYTQGRAPVDQVNEARAAAGLGPILQAQNEIPVTWAKPGESLHNYDLALDCVPIEGGKPAWSTQHPAWSQVIAYAVEAGLEPGAFWSRAKREFPHFQYAGGLSLAQIKKGRVPL